MLSQSLFLKCISDKFLRVQSFINKRPGDRTRITGIYRTLPNKNGGGTSGVFRSILLANNIDLLVHHGSTTQLSRNDVMRIKKFANTHKSKVFNKLSTAIAPSICGHEYIKKAVLCQLMGGMEKNLENGTHIRGYVCYFHVFCSPNTA
eukprot:Pgem_evm1s5865